MLGRTTFHFVKEGIEVALGQARTVAGEADNKISCGVETVLQFVLAGHVDEIHIAPVVLDHSEALFAGIDLRALRYRTVEHVPTERATHIVLAK
jgi:dihydrofolate reductase